MVCEMVLVLVVVVVVVVEHCQRGCCIGNDLSKNYYY